MGEVTATACQSLTDSRTEAHRPGMKIAGVPCMEQTRRNLDATTPLLVALFLLVLPASSFSGQAPRHQPHDAIIDAARQHVLDRTDLFSGKLSVRVHPPDRRLRLTLCDQPLQTYESPNGLKPGRSVVGVRCEGSKPWKLFVSVSIATLQPVVITRTPLARGQLIQAQDLEIAERDTARLHKAFYADSSRLAGLRAKRNVQAGKVVTPSMLTRNQVVSRGSQVEILANAGNLEVRMRGKALANGAIGERIRVQNLTSGRKITGLVIEPGVVQVQH